MAQPPKRPPWANITPLASSVISTSAVTLLEQFLMLRSAFSLILIAPGYRVRLVRSPINVGRPATSGKRRSSNRSSRGKAPFSTASWTNCSFIAARRSGYWLDRSCARLKSSCVLNNCQPVSSLISFSFLFSHGSLTVARANHPLL